MSFTSLLKGIGQGQVRYQERDCFNPINKINKGLKKGRFFNNKENIECMNKESNSERAVDNKLSFGSLSKNKDLKSPSSNKMHSIEMKINSASIGQKRSSQKIEVQYSSIRKRLNFNMPTHNEGQSNEKRLNFTDIIKNSIEKDIKQPSISKYSQKKLIKPPVKEGNTFNKLKNRLINQRQTVIKSQHKLQEIAKSKYIPPVSEHLQMVRVSMQQQISDELQLDMNPSL